MCSWRIALLERFWQARHPPRYAAFKPPSSPSSRHSSASHCVRHSFCYSPARRRAARRRMGLGVFGIGACVGSGGAGVISDRLGANRTLKASYAVKAVAVMIPLVAPDLATVLVSCFLVGAL